MSIDYICREVSRIMRKYDESDPWELAAAMGIIVTAGSLCPRIDGFKCRLADGNRVRSCVA